LRSGLPFSRRETLHIKEKFHTEKADHQNHHPDNERHRRNPVVTDTRRGTAPAYRRRNRFRALALLEIRITIHRHALGIFERIQIRSDVNAQELAVDEQETFRVSQTRELGKVVGFNFRQPLRANLGHPRGFIEREISRASRILKFLTKALYCHERTAG
jgi:hypothetical protein